MYVDKAVQVPVAQQNGTTWGTAYATIQAGVDAAVNKSDGIWAVWVRGESAAVSGGNPYCDGVYNEIITIDPARDFYVFGGFNGTEEPYFGEEGGAELVAKERSWIKNPTYIDGTDITSGAMHLVTVTGNVHVDGFTFCNGELLGGPIQFAPGNVDSIISNSIIEYNYAPWSVGGITVSGGTVKIVNCLFRDNIGSFGILCLTGSGIADIINCTIEDNIASGSIIYESSSADANIANSILWDNACSQLINGSPSITYSCVQGGYTGTGNINQDPIFVDAIPALSYGSPCIDAGIITEAPDHDIMKNPRPLGYGVDMGAYEGVYSTDFEGVVVINEVLVENEATNQDEDEDYSPWLELQNTSLSNVSLQGWTLTHGATYWTFPNITLAGGEYKLVFLSGKNRTGSELHTNFTLSSQGGTILLQDNQTPVVNYMYFDYPADMPTDVSYGFNESDNVDSYNKELNPIQPLRPPTPEESNNTYFGHALVAAMTWDPVYTKTNLPIIGGTRGYKVEFEPYPTRQYLEENFHKYNLFYINAEGVIDQQLNGGFETWATGPEGEYICTDDIEQIIGEEQQYKFVHLNSCRCADQYEQWLEAFNTVTFLGWYEQLLDLHGMHFDDWFYSVFAKGGQTIKVAAQNANFMALDNNPVIEAYYSAMGLPVACPEVFGNEDQRLDSPDSTHTP